MFSSRIWFVFDIDMFQDAVIETLSICGNQYLTFFVCEEAKLVTSRKNED